MNRTLFVVPFVLVAAAATAVQAGWHHRHAYQAAPAYYMPAYAPSFAPNVIQSAPSAQNALGDIILAKLVDKLIGSIDKVDILPGGKKEETGNGGGGSASDASIKQDLSDIKAALKELDARVENANSALQRHGSEILAIRQAVEGLKDGGQDSLIEKLEKTSDIGKAASKVRRSEIIADLLAVQTEKKVTDAVTKYKDASAADKKKTLTELREAVKGLLDGE